jgi:hypothetical protein
MLDAVAREMYHICRLEKRQNVRFGRDIGIRNGGASCSLDDADGLLDFLDHKSKTWHVRGMGGLSSEAHKIDLFWGK